LVIREFFRWKRQGNDLSHRYLWGPGVDQLLADEQVTSLEAEGEVLWALADHLGSIRDWVDSEGTVVDHAVFDSFGNRTNADAIDAVFEWTGVYRDPVTGLQWNRARWYNPAIQRWMSEDPIKDGFNWHIYVVNAPTMYTDPRGLEPPSGGSTDQGIQNIIDPKRSRAQAASLPDSERLTQLQDRLKKLKEEWANAQKKWRSNKALLDDIKKEIDAEIRTTEKDIRAVRDRVLVADQHKQLRAEALRSARGAREFRRSEEKGSHTGTL
jgi:RHS repeat-associated protein